MLLFEKGDVPQSLYMDKNFPEEEIEDLVFLLECFSFFFLEKKTKRKVVFLKF